MKIIAMTNTHPLWEETRRFSAQCPWQGGVYLSDLMQHGQIRGWERVFAAYDGDQPAGFCTLTEYDESLPEYGFSPFIGCLFVAEPYRGQRLSERMIRAAAAYAREAGFQKVYIMSGETGLYEKYGFRLRGLFQSKFGETEQIFEAGTEDPAAAARQSFEAAFAEGDYYNRQTQDAAHLSALMQMLQIQPDMQILDLGTGSGYLAFALARRHPDVTVTGLDIAAETLARNQAQAEREQLPNLRFVSYGGTEMPFADGTFDAVVSRYALHHFSDMESSIAEISRVLKPDGCFLLSDPAPDDADAARFIDAYMQVKHDGHVRFYTQAEWCGICGRHGLTLTQTAVSSIRFPRRYEPAYDGLLRQYADIAERYAVGICGDEIYITEQVNNLLFRKR